MAASGRQAYSDLFLEILSKRMATVHVPTLALTEAGVAASLLFLLAYQFRLPVGKSRVHWLWSWIMRWNLVVPDRVTNSALAVDR